ncbi:MAG TPA: transposase [Gemmatimonadales bacterium]|nr:transposase [Gemmatimonadales bacterium]
MRQRLHFHLAWTTLDRAPLTDARLARFLCGFPRAVAMDERARVLQVGMVSTHLHLLIAGHPATQWPRLVQLLKGGSAAFANRTPELQRAPPLRWQPGYTLETVSPSLVERTRHYLRTRPTVRITPRPAPTESLCRRPVTAFGKSGMMHR